METLSSQIGLCWRCGNRRAWTDGLAHHRTRNKKRCAKYRLAHETHEHPPSASELADFTLAVAFALVADDREALHRVPCRSHAVVDESQEVLFDFAATSILSTGAGAEDVQIGVYSFLIPIVFRLAGPCQLLLLGRVF